MSRGNGMTGVRIREGDFEGQCAYCLEYLPLTSEFWWLAANVGVRRCKACHLEYKRIKQAGYVASKRVLYNAAVRARLAFLTPEERERRRGANRDWKARNRERIAAYNRAYRARKAA